jgi:hypothetical protein
MECKTVSGSNQLWGDLVQVYRGDTVRTHDLVAVDEATVPVRDPKQPTHRPFRRFVSCPSAPHIYGRWPPATGEFAAADVHDGVLFDSMPRELFTYTRDRPLDVVDDRDKQLDKRFGVETSLRGLLEPRASASVLGAMFQHSGSQGKPTSAGTAARSKGVRLALPADVLIDHGGTVFACNYGAHAYDQWSVDEPLALAGTLA